ncbi:hypothetical protein J4477_04820 [Candidatus Pacearchaeota archaeon]|nr:hypothetical protein [Candidatus Pacearchaeota archaeon]
MKKVMFLSFGIFLLFLLPLANACTLDAALINQDPYPALPGEYVKVVFQVTGLGDSTCGSVTFQLIPEYPFSLDSGVSNEITIRSDTYAKDYSSNLVVPYKLRIDENALDGDNEIKTRVFTSNINNNIYLNRNFNISVEDSRTDFEVHVKDYSYDTKKLIFEILNSGKNDVEALTFEIPDQDNFRIIGSNRYIVGDLGSNEEDVASFEADISKEEITIDILYTDQVGVRRNVQETVQFNPDHFQAKIERGRKIGSVTAFIIGILTPIVVFLIYKFAKKRRIKKNLRKFRHNS